MPITTIASHLTVGSAVQSHWSDVNADRLANTLAEFELPGGYDLAQFTVQLSALQTSITSQEDLDNAISLAANDRDNQRRNLRERLIEFRDALRLHMKSSGYFQGLPKTPNDSSSEQKVLRAADDMASLWTRINADATIPNFTPPLLLRGNYALAGCNTDVTTMRTYFKAVVDTENAALIGRKNRDILLEPLRDRLVEYRLAIEVEYGPGHPLVQSLPDIYPQPGSTPDAVTLAGEWDETAQSGVLTWNESTNPDLLEYSIRMTFGPTWDNANNSIVGTETPLTSQHLTVEGLGNAGDMATFKVYVVLSTGNESGSNAVTITKPSNGA